MTDNFTNVLHELALPDTGRYINHFYVIELADSNEYSKMYTLLDTNAINTEDPSFGKAQNGTTEKITNYFEYETDTQTYNIFLIADFVNDCYFIKIGQR